MKSTVQSKMIRIGLISNCHGINGELKIMPLTDDINRFKKLKKFYLENKANDYQELTCASSRIHKDYVLLKAEEINDRTQAERIKGKYICVKEEDAIKLPEGRYFIFQLEGLDVYEDERFVGVLTEVLQPGANDVYVIKPPQGEEIYLPAIKSAVLSVDLENKRMQIKIPEGLLD